MSLLIIYVSITLLVSFVCSMTEASLLSITPTYVRKMINEKKRFGLILEEYQSKIEQPLSAILTLNTIANTIGSVGAGVQAQKVFNSPWITLFAISFTFSILIISEIIPKTIGASYWKPLAPFCAYFIKIIIFLLYPFVLLSIWITGLLISKEKNDSSYYRKEIEIIAEMGGDQGEISSWQKSLIHNILRLDNIKVEKIMTPRTVILSYTKNMTVGEVLKQSHIIPFSRIPVIDKNLDNITGLVLRSDILESAAEDKLDLTLSSLLRPIHPVPESLSVVRALEQFIQRQEHIFLVVDEYGGTAGIVTLEDTMETLLGKEIVDEKDTVTDMRELAFKKWKNKVWLMKKKSLKTGDNPLAINSGKDSG